MLPAAEARCVQCQLVFCCGGCRQRHERSRHGLEYSCPVCRGRRFLCQPERLSAHLVRHLVADHAPLHCTKCAKVFNEMDDFVDVDECTSISELLDKDSVKSDKKEEIDDRFDSIYEKTNGRDAADRSGTASGKRSGKTAVVTPTVRRKHLVDYESSDSDSEGHLGAKDGRTPYPAKYVTKCAKSRRSRAATPHARKLSCLTRQRVVYGEDDETPAPGATPTRDPHDAMKDSPQESRTPTAPLPLLLQLSQAVRTSTPTHPATPGWSLFPETGNDSPLSEIENSAQNLTNEPSKSESAAPKLKSIIATGSQLKSGSQDGQDKQVTFQDSENNTEVSSVKTKRVKFADNTVFENQNKVKRVFRKPKRMLTPGPQKPRFGPNPRFQALINRFEAQGLTAARTPVAASRELPPDGTPPVGDHSAKPARAIHFRDDSPVVEASGDSNDTYKTCVDSPEVGHVGGAITALTANIAGSLQTCLSSLLRTSEEETEIQFQLVITKKKIGANRLVGDGEDAGSAASEATRRDTNIWSSVAKAVKNVFWGEQDPSLGGTPRGRVGGAFTPAKRKLSDTSDAEESPASKRHKLEGRVRGRPPLRRVCPWAGAPRSPPPAPPTPDRCNLSF